MLILIILTLIGVSILVMGFFDIRIPFFTGDDNSYKKEENSVPLKKNLKFEKKAA